MQIFPFTQKEINFFKQLNKNKIPYIIVGLASAALQGAPIVTKDVDLWFRDISDKKLQNIIKKSGGIYVPPIEMNPPALAGKDFNLLDIVMHVHGIGSFDEEYKNRIKIRVAGVMLRLLPLESVIRSKEMLRREKDILVLPALKDTLMAKKERKGRKI